MLFQSTCEIENISGMQEDFKLHLVKTAIQVVQIPYYLHARGMQEILDYQIVDIFYHLYEWLIIHLNRAKCLTSEIFIES